MWLETIRIIKMNLNLKGRSIINKNQSFFLEIHWHVPYPIVSCFSPKCFVFRHKILSLNGNAQTTVCENGKSRISLVELSA